MDIDYLRQTKGATSSQRPIKYNRRDYFPLAKEALTRQSEGRPLNVEGSHEDGLDRAKWRIMCRKADSASKLDER